MMNMNLEEKYNQLKESIAKVDFARLWEGFTPLKFALYNDTECYFDGRYIEKTDDFCANTAIEYQGEIIAIWNVMEEMEISVFTSKIIHEMFHGFQEKQGWDCWPKETEALFNYRYREENLSIKLRENKLLLELLEGFDREKYRELLACRKYRSERFPYEFGYECRGEEIEGSANYVEWQVLRQLDARKADQLTEDMRRTMLMPECFFPIRISGYYTGALLINAMISAGGYNYGPANRPVIMQKLDGMEPVSEVYAGTEEEHRQMADAVASYTTESKRIVETAVAANEVVLTGPRELVTVNIYNARCYNGYLTSTYFLMYLENGERKMIQGNFVIRMKDVKTIDTVYSWK